MENLQKTNGQDLAQISSKQNLLTKLEGGNKVEIQQHLELFRERGDINQALVLSIPQTERIPQIIKQENGYMRVAAVLTASLKSAIDNINLRVGMNEDQVVELALEIITQSHEDNLALEDVLLFLKNLITGKCGKIYDRLDMPTFFELFETYRQERYEALKKIKEEQHAQLKSLGDTERTTQEDPLDKHFALMAGRMSDMKEKLKDAIGQVKKLKDIDKF